MDISAIEDKIIFLCSQGTSARDIEKAIDHIDDMMLYDNVYVCIFRDLLMTHFLTHMTARGCDRLPEITKFVVYYKRYKFGNIRDYGRLLKITSD